MSAPVPEQVWNAPVGLADTRVFFRATHAGALLTCGVRQKSVDEKKPLSDAFRWGLV